MTMEENNKKVLASQAEKFLKDFLETFLSNQKYLTREKSSEINSAALVYEKIRVAMEYQEEHLIFKNAIARILRRRYTLLPSIKSLMLTQDLMRELAWADYVNPETLDKKTWTEIGIIIDRYLVILNNLNCGIYSKLDLQKKIIDWMACEIEDNIRPKEENELLINYASSILNKNLIINSPKISPEDNDLLLKITVYNLLFKPDIPLVEYYLLNKIYPNFKSFNIAEAKKFALSFEPYFNKINRYLNHPLRTNYVHYVKRFIPPFIVLRSTLASGNFIAENVLQAPSVLETETMETYRAMINSARTKVFRGTMRALIFILFTKIILALIIEVPYDRYFTGGIHFLSLFINILTPVILMFVAGTFVKSPPPKNAKFVAEAVSRILYDGNIGEKKFNLILKKSNRSFAIFNLFYGLFNIAILVGVIWLLLILQFNLVSIILFFLFISIVSFFSFRIRNIALELAMQRSSDDAITSAIEVLFLPFIKIGKYISGKFALFNPTMMLVDFLIEAPLKTIIRIVNYWRRFVNAKKEEMEY